MEAAAKIGVLALQGDFDAHRKRLEELGAEVVLVRNPEQLDELEGLVIPGGESSTFLRLLGEAGVEKLKEFVRVKPTFGTCAGAILLASEIENPQKSGWACLISGFGGMHTGDSWTVQSARENLRMRRSRWCSSAPLRSNGLEREWK